MGSWREGSRRRACAGLEGGRRWWQGIAGKAGRSGVAARRGFGAGTRGAGGRARQRESTGHRLSAPRAARSSPVRCSGRGTTGGASRPGCAAARRDARAPASRGDGRRRAREGVRSPSSARAPGPKGFWSRSRISVFCAGTRRRSATMRACIVAPGREGSPWHHGGHRRAVDDGRRSPRRVVMRRPPIIRGSARRARGVSERVTRKSARPL